MNTDSTSGMVGLLTAHCIEFNDRVIVVEEIERGVKLRAIGRGFKADYDHSRNKWICYTPIPSGLEVHIRRSSLKGLIVSIESTLMS